jgi:hypothetical protein
MVSASQVGGAQTERHARMPSFPAGCGDWRGGACDGDKGRQRSATFQVKAAPADEARAVHRTRRREVPAPRVLQWGFAVDAQAEAAVG